MNKAFFFILILLSAMQAVASPNPDEILGVWQNGSGKGHIQIYKENGKYFGKIVWLKSPLDEKGQPKVDKKNQNAALRNKPLIGLVMLRDIKYDDGEWTDGHIYNPEDGKEYKCVLKLKDSRTLSVRGYIGFSWIGKSDTWLRVNKPVAANF